MERSPKNKGSGEARRAGRLLGRALLRARKPGGATRLSEAYQRLEEREQAELSRPARIKKRG
jgi:hypothetical protein